MYVVRRPFRDAIGMVLAGSIIEPASIKRFKHRLQEGHIVEVTEQNFDEYASFFKQRYGVDITLPVPDVSIDVPDVKVDTPDVKIDIPDVKIDVPDVKPVASTVKPVVKTQAKASTAKTTSVKKAVSK